MLSLVLMLLAARMTITIIGQIATQGTTRRPANTGTDGGASRTAQAVANDRTTGRTQPATNGRFRTAALASPHRTAGGATHTGANRSAGAAAHLLADHITQDTAKTTADRSGTVASGHCALSNHKPKHQGGQSQTHDKNLKNAASGKIGSVRAGASVRQSASALTVGPQTQRLFYDRQKKSPLGKRAGTAF
jgi:hypothetical protein